MDVYTALSILGLTCLFLGAAVVSGAGFAITISFILSYIATKFGKRELSPVRFAVDEDLIAAEKAVEEWLN